MVIKTAIVPHHTEEVLDEQDREEVHRMIIALRQSYVERHTEALSTYHKIERDANRALHEVNRVERHLERINEFCNKNGIPFGNEVTSEK
ncbi:MAG: hypothetical protein JWO54_125 [Candidatus Saccharibacteria bacterium]|nr:hypothetical protein [Candidatus Saccharibacteria bacterium]MDB5180367.1 hypothetical protein [Candidatus Saccharibacteria bacterium]